MYDDFEERVNPPAKEQEAVDMDMDERLAKLQ